MVLYAPRVESYLKHQQKEQSYIMFIYKYPVTHQKFPGINPMGLGAPWVDSYL